LCRDVLFSGWLLCGYLIRKRKDDINAFFELAGFPYRFCIDAKGTQEATTFLQPASGATTKVNALQQHLSWGELNAFSLIMFMFDAVSKNADLIILDDPISAFDANKKFAIIQRMFSNAVDVSFHNKTVLMLTHDSQPLLDYVRTDIEKYHIIMPINAMFLQNMDGVLSEIPIGANDLKSIIEITTELSKDINLPKACRIVNLRKKIECSMANVNDYIPYHILSNLVHNRLNPTISAGVQLEEEQFTQGCKQITNDHSIEDFDYSGWLNEVSIEKLIEEYQKADAYSKVLITRFLIEQDSEKANIIRKTLPGLCKFLHESNHIENDYIYQLDPRKYYSIPSDYESELDDFVLEQFCGNN
jgi:hypothetical protein